jgi:tetratricopeptide (TPR) repeat protein
VLDGLGELWLDQGRITEAEPMLRQAAESCRQVQGEIHLCTLTARRHLGALLAIRGRYGEAEQVLKNLVDVIRQTPSVPADFLAGCLNNLASVYVATGRYQLAEPLLNQSLDLVSQQGPPQVIADTLLNLGELYRLEHNAVRAEPLFKKALHLYEAANDPLQAGALSQLGRLALDQGKFATARELFRQSLCIYEHVFGPSHPLAGRLKGALAEAALGEYNYAEAKTLIRDAMATERKTSGAGDSAFARMLMIAGEIEEQSHRANQAAAYYREALDIYRKSLDSEHPERAQAEQEYARFAKSLRK